MKRYAIGLVIVVAALVFAGNAWAQAPTVHVGFGFAALGKMWDAGNYTVEIASNGNVVLTAEKGGAVVEVKPLKTISKTAKKAELVFDRVGETMFLTEVWLPGKGACKVNVVDLSEERKVAGTETK